jgi:5-methylcytosine-specific restriction endonuclease McrBC GTP-binding regulatory subunit McrB
MPLAKTLNDFETSKAFEDLLEEVNIDFGGGFKHESFTDPRNTDPKIAKKWTLMIYNKDRNARNNVGKNPWHGFHYEFNYNYYNKVTMAVDLEFKDPSLNNKYKMILEPFFKEPPYIPSHERKQRSVWCRWYCNVLEDEMVERMKTLIKEVEKFLSKKEMEKPMEQYVALLEANKNLILTGAPGTGKTYLAKQIAMQMVGVNNEASGQFAFVQFHPSYDYTDFVEGLRPTPPNESNQIGFERKDGVFKEFCKKAVENQDKNFVFIIDEINRGEISKIFGELFFSIDPGYRGIKGKVNTQYQNMIDKESDDVFNKGFYVPENVYIIGTMNDIDRSVESFDFAMRRRFTWEEVKAEDNLGMLDKLDNDLGTQAKEKLIAINNIISDIPELGSAYHIGGAYFLKLENYKNEQNPFDKLWDYHLEPLLREYLRGKTKEEMMEEMEKLKSAYNG